LNEPREPMDSNGKV